MVAAPLQVTSHAVFRLPADLVAVGKGILFASRPFPLPGHDGLETMDIIHRGRGLLKLISQPDIKSFEYGKTAVHNEAFTGNIGTGVAGQQDNRTFDVVSVASHPTKSRFVRVSADKFLGQFPSKTTW